jgi:glucose-6-phosphate 1-dehydrogenase
MPQTLAADALVLLGATGDLARRMLLASLFYLDADGFLAADFRIVATARTALDRESFLTQARAAIDERLEPIDAAVWGRFANRITYVSADLAKPGGAAPLTEALAGVQRPVFFLAISPSLYIPVVNALGEAGLAGPGARIILEKPIGRDLETSRQINDAIGAVFSEERTFRIDHYLGKETVQNILVLRFANTIFEPIWNRNYIANVQITAAETVGVEERAGYYESSGALRDMVQNHLTQILALTAMEPPGRFDAEAIRNEKAKVLQAARLANDNEPWTCCVRGQYTAGGSSGRPIPGYRQEPGVDPNSTTETYVATKLFVDNWRWQGVPFYIRTGKRLPKRLSEVVLTFREAPVHLFDAAGGAPTPNQLILRIQPDEGTNIRFEVKAPGSGMRSRPVDMGFSYDESFGEPSDEGYVRLLADAMLGDPTLFTRSDEVEAAWRLYTPVLELIEDSPWQLPVQPYEARTWGPAASDSMLAEDGLGWRRP